MQVWTLGVLTNSVGARLRRKREEVEILPKRDGVKLCGGVTKANCQSYIIRVSHQIWEHQ